MSQKIGRFFPLFLVLYEIASLLANDAYLPALPTMQQQLHLSLMQAEFTLGAFFLGTAISQLCLGPVSDHFGRKPLLLGGAWIFAAASIGCAISGDVTMLLICRVIQGGTLAVITVAGYASILESYPPEKAMSTMAWMGGLLVLVPALGPLFGVGLLHIIGSWRFVFALLAGAVLLISIGLVYTTPALQKVRTPFRIKPHLQAYHGLLKNRFFVLRTLSFACFFSALIAWIVSAPFYIMTQLHHSMLYYALIQVAVFGCFMIGTAILPTLVRKKGQKYSYQFGLTLGVAGAVGSLVMACISGNLTHVVPLLMIMAFGLSFSQSISIQQTIGGSGAPMGVTVSLFCTVMNTIALLCTLLISYLPNKDLLTIVSVICCLCVLAGIFSWLARRGKVATTHEPHLQ